MGNCCAEAGDPGSLVIEGPEKVDNTVSEGRKMKIMLIQAALRRYAASKKVNKMRSNAIAAKGASKKVDDAVTPKSP